MVAVAGFLSHYLKVLVHQIAYFRVEGRGAPNFYTTFYIFLMPLVTYVTGLVVIKLFCIWPIHPCHLI